MGRREIDENKLFDVAINEFSQFSFEEASINRIISDAGITKGSFYYRFSNKYDLYLHLLRKANKLKWDFIKEKKSTEIDYDGRDVFALFLQQAEIGMRFADENPQYHKLGKMFSSEKGNPVYKMVLKDLELNDESGLSDIIKSAYDSGTFKEIYSLEFIDKLITSLFYSFDDILFKNEDFDLEKAMLYLKEFVNFFMYGLKNENQGTQ